jgi:hypothetical protein
MRTLILVGLLGIAELNVLAAQDKPACSLAETTVAEITPANAVDLNCAAIPGDDGRYFIGWTTRSKDGEPTSHLRLVRVKDEAVTILDKHRIPGGYATLFDYTARFNRRRRPIWFLTVQYGAAQQDLWLLSPRQRSFQMVDTLGGDYLETTPSGGDDDLLVAHDSVSGIDAPRLYRFRSGRFVNVSWQHPAYYRELLAKNGWSVDGKDVDPTLYPQLAHLLFLADDVESGRGLLKIYRSPKKVT